jgi:hypothetical protein
MNRYLTGAAAALPLALAASQPCCAVFTGLQLELHTTFNAGGGGPKSVYRLYATFSQPSDQLFLWSGSKDFAAIFRTCDGANQAGTSFFNHASGADRAPSQSAIDASPNVRWDTFVTIGVNVAEQGVPGDQTLITPNFPIFINGNLWTSNIDAVFVIPGAAQSRADFAGDGDLPLRVVLAQLTCKTGEIIGGRVGSLTWRNGAGQSFTLTNLLWNSTATTGICCVGSNCVTATPAACASVYHGTFLGCAVCQDCIGPCYADISGNDVVNIEDLLTVIEEWGVDGGPADVNHDGIVDVADVLAVIAAWGPCP